MPWCRCAVRAIEGVTWCIACPAQNRHASYETHASAQVEHRVVSIATLPVSKREAGRWTRAELVKFEARKPPETTTRPVTGSVARRSVIGTKTDTPLLKTPQASAVITKDDIEGHGTPEQRLEEEIDHPFIFP